MQGDVFAKASQVAAGDDRAIAGARYDGAALSLHWLTAILVVTLFALAEIWGFLPRGPLRHSLQHIHISLGIALFVVVVLRLIWRGTLSRRVPPADRGAIAGAAHAAHYGLYLLLILMIVSGPLKQWSEGHSLSFFSLLSVPAPVDVPKTWHKPASLIHFWAAWALIVIAGLHAAAALFHQYVLKDGLLLRMMPSRRPVRGH